MFNIKDNICLYDKKLNKYYPDTILLLQKAVTSRPQHYKQYIYLRPSL